MEETMVVTYKLQGTVEKIEEMRSRIVSLQVCKEIVGMHIRYIREKQSIRKEDQTEEKVIERHKKLLKDKKKFVSLEEI